jgi:hypothetical protein
VAHLAERRERAVAVEPGGRGQIGLGDDDGVRAAERSLVLVRLVLALRDGQQHDAEGLAQVERRRAHEVADVLDDEQLEPLEVEFPGRARHHAGLEMADRAGRHLHDVDPGLAHSPRVVVRGQVADDDRAADPGREVGECPGEQRRLPRAGRGTGR